MPTDRRKYRSPVEEVQALEALLTEGFEQWDFVSADDTDIAIEHLTEWLIARGVRVDPVLPVDPVAELAHLAEGDTRPHVTTKMTAGAESSRPATLTDVAVERLTALLREFFTAEAEPYCRLVAKRLIRTRGVFIGVAHSGPSQEGVSGS